MRLSLRWKIVGGFGLLLALVALLALVTLSLFSSLRGVQRKVFRDAVPELIAVDELIRSYTAQSAAVRGFLIGSQSGLLLQYRQEVASARVWEERALDLFERGEGRELLEQLIDAGHSFQELVDDEVVPLAQRGKRSRAFYVLGQEGVPLIAEIETAGALLRENQDRTMARTENELRVRSNQALIILLLVTGVALIVGTVLVIDLPRRLLRDLAALVDATRAIERGDFDHRISIRSGDEVEELAVRFGEMQRGLKRLQQLAMQDRELEIAAAVQRNLLQRSVPDVPGAHVAPLQRQANLVGGDWYDIHHAGPTLSVTIGDASGKGIGAALMAAIALSVLRAERRLGAAPKAIVRRTNEALREATDPDSFTTLIYATLDTHTGELAWLNMGHLSPFLLRRVGDGDPSGYYLEGPRNRALGWYEDPGLAETVVRLEPGDRLCLFTDGFIEAKSPDGEVFGEHRLAQRLVALAGAAPAALASRLVEDVERFTAGKLDDDLTMIVVEFEGASLEARPDQGTGVEAWHSRR